MPKAKVLPTNLFMGCLLDRASQSRRLSSIALESACFNIIDELILGCEIDGQKSCFISLQLEAMKKDCQGEAIREHLWRMDRYPDVELDSWSGNAPTWAMGMKLFLQSIILFVRRLFQLS